MPACTRALVLAPQCTKATDVYAFGQTVQEFLKSSDGEDPCTSSDDEASGSKRKAALWAGEYPDAAMKRVCERALRKSPRLRPTMDEVVECLASMYARLQLERNPPSWTSIASRL